MKGQTLTPALLHLRLSAFGMVLTTLAPHFGPIVALLIAVPVSILLSKV